MLIVTRAGVLQGVCVVEGSSASKRVTAPGSDNDRDGVLDGVRMDVEREHKSVCSYTPGRESV